MVADGDRSAGQGDRSAGQSDRFDAIVVGVGGMGSATAYHLAARGADVLGIERYDVPHARGSSHGLTRVIRKAYYESPDYVPLLERAYELWADLDDGHPTDLLHRTGTVFAGPAGSDRVAGALTACREHDLAHERLTGDDLGDHYPGFDLPADYDVLFEPEGGFLHVEQCVVAHVEAAHRHGAEIRARERVVGWTPTDDDGVRVETTNGDYYADRLVVTAGAWTPKLLPDLADLLEPERQVLGWFQPADPDDFGPDAFPVFIVDAPDGAFYGFPVYRVPGVKVGKYNHFAEAVDPDDFAREPTPRDERVLRGFTEEYLTGAAGPTMRLDTCLFTNTPDEHFIIDHHPDHPQVVVGAGFSGHGFKLSSVIGEILADLALDGHTDHPIDLFSLDRF